MIDQTRKRVLKTLNSRYIYGKVPLLHAIIFIVELAIVLRLIAKFNSSYDDKPILTMMVTNALLAGIADTVAQTLTAIRSRPSGKIVGNGKDDFFSIEIEDLDKKPTSPVLDPSASWKRLPPSFDFERMTRFMAYGFVIAPIQFKWFQFLADAFPITKSSATIPALKRVALDQLVFAPITLACFFAFMTVAEGGGRRAIQRKVQDVYFSALKAQFILWPVVQILNFRIIPVQFQLPFVATIGIAWTAYLSLTNSVDDE